MNSVVIVLLNWNGFSYTADCLKSLARLNRSGCEVTTVVVDNHSQDGSVAKIRKMFPGVVTLPQERNLGYAGGNNVGFRYALQNKVGYVWVLNNDTLVHEQALAELVRYVDRPGVGVLGAKIYFADGKEYHKNRYKKEERGKVIWYAGGKIDWANMYASHRGVDEVDTGQYEQVSDTDFVTGCSFFAPVRVLQQTGVFDEKFYMYLEDLDLCMRIKRRGYRLIYVPQAVIWHINAGSSGGSGSRLHEYYQTRNRLLVGMRYAPVRTKISLIREAAKMLITGSTVTRKAVLDFLFMKYGRQYYNQI